MNLNNIHDNRENKGVLTSKPLRQQVSNTKDINVQCDKGVTALFFSSFSFFFFLSLFILQPLHFVSKYFIMSLLFFFRRVPRGPSLLYRRIELGFQSDVQKYNHHLSQSSCKNYTTKKIRIH